MRTLAVVPDCPKEASVISLMQAALSRVGLDGLPVDVLVANREQAHAAGARGAAGSPPLVTAGGR